MYINDTHDDVQWCVDWKKREGLCGGIWTWCIDCNDVNNKVLCDWYYDKHTIANRKGICLGVVIGIKLIMEEVMKMVKGGEREKMEWNEQLTFGVEDKHWDDDEYSDKE